MKKKTRQEELGTMGHIQPTINVVNWLPILKQTQKATKESAGSLTTAIL